jgi:hypothetical protein
MTGCFVVSSATTSIKSILLSARQAKHCITAPIHARAHGAISVYEVTSSFSSLTCVYLVG